jgi:hypothetical protein
MGRLASLGQRVGYGLLLLGIVAFVAGLFVGFGGWAGTVVIASLAGTCVTLAPAIVLGYAVRAAQREDDERASGNGSSRRR